MSNYLGETELTSLVGTPFEGFGPSEWVLEYISAYGQIDGAHHKQWVLDEVARILKGTPVVVSIARWEDGKEEYRYSTADPPSDDYTAWVQERLNSGYGYDEGIAP